MSILALRQQLVNVTSANKFVHTCELPKVLCTGPLSALKRALGVGLMVAEA
jgi:hypothetical protein